MDSSKRFNVRMGKKKTQTIHANPGDSSGDHTEHDSNSQPARMAHRHDQETPLPPIPSDPANLHPITTTGAGGARATYTQNQTQSPVHAYVLYLAA